ncbi:MAG: hypothetical protein ACXVDD_16855 [Polyangia bacterium]
MALALLTMLAGCDEKKEPASATTVVPAPTPTTAVAPSGAAVAPSGAAVVPSGAAAAPSGAAEKPEAGKGDKVQAKAVAPVKRLPPPPGAMPHGNPEDGTLKYNPPPAQNPPPPKNGAATH